MTLVRAGVQDTASDTWMMTHHRWVQSVLVCLLLPQVLCNVPITEGYQSTCTHVHGCCVCSVAKRTPSHQLHPCPV